MRNLTLGDKLLISHLAAVFLVAGSAGTFLYRTATHSVLVGLRERLAHSAAFAAVSVDPASLAAIAQREIAAPDYARLQGVLRHVSNATPGVVYVYVLRRQGDKLFYVADSEPTAAAAKPGTRYQGKVAALLPGFSGPHADEKLYGDEWGEFMSGYAPIGTDGEYLIGIDVQADEFARTMKHLRLAGLLSFLCGGLLSIALARWFSRRMMVPIDRHAKHTARIAVEDYTKRINVQQLLQGTQPPGGPPPPAAPPPA